MSLKPQLNKINNPALVLSSGHSVPPYFQPVLP